MHSKPGVGERFDGQGVTVRARASRRDDQGSSTNKGIANPVASFWTAAQMLDHLGEQDGCERLMHAVERVTAVGILTPDIGGTATTRQATDAVVDAIFSANV